MYNLDKAIFEQVKSFLHQSYGVELTEAQLQLQETKPEFEGEITLVVFPLLKLIKANPEQLASQIGQHLVESLQPLKQFTVVKGFLNLSLADEYVSNLLLNELTKGDFGYFKPTGQTVLVEYSSPNTNKPLHLGHLRNNFLGHSVSRLLKAVGHNVAKVQIINDRGIHICKSMVAWRRFGNNETPESSGIKGDHLVGKYYVAFDKAYKSEVEALIGEGKEEKWAKANAPIMLEAQAYLRKWEEGDNEIIALWQKMNNWVYDGFSTTYAKMRVDFDKLYYESNTYLLGKDQVEDGLKKGVFQRDGDGSVWVDLTNEGLDRKLLLRSDGTAVYITQDIGTAILRAEDFPGTTQMIYTVGNEQDYHFKVLFLILQKLGYSWANQCKHLSYGMVDLPSGKMKSREGTVVDADDLMQEMYETAKEKAEQLGKLEGLEPKDQANLFEIIGLAALKYFILKVDPKKRMLFDPAESVDFAGNTGPFIQYAYARIQAIKRRADSVIAPENPPIALESAEKELILQLHKLPQIIMEAATGLSPAVVANYTYDVVKKYNHFYQNHPIFTEQMALTQFRVLLSHITGEVIQRCMYLMGIEVPERM